MTKLLDFRDMSRVGMTEVSKMFAATVPQKMFNSEDGGIKIPRNVDSYTLTTRIVFQKIFIFEYRSFLPLS